MILTRIIKKDLSEVQVIEPPRHISDKILHSHLVIKVHNRHNKSVLVYIDDIASFNITVEVE